MRRLLAAALLALVLVPSAAAAAKSPVFGLRAFGNPKLGYFVYPVSAGTTVHGAVSVTNMRSGTVGDASDGPRR